MAKSIVFLSNITFYTWDEDINKQIRLFKQFDIDGVEVAFRKVENLNKLTEETKEFLRSFEFNSIHGPPLEDCNGNKILEDLKKLANEVNAKNIIFHPNKSLKNDNLDICIENQKEKEPLTKELLEKNQKFKLCFDVSHSNTTGETKELLEKYFDRIAEVHFSANSENKRHVPLVNAKEGFFDDLDKLKKKDVPFVLEAKYPPNNIKLIKEDIEFVRKWLQK